MQPLTPRRTRFRRREVSEVRVRERAQLAGVEPHGHCGVLRRARWTIRVRLFARMGAENNCASFDRTQAYVTIRFVGFLATKVHRRGTCPIQTAATRPSHRSTLIDWAYGNARLLCGRTAFTVGEKSSSFIEKKNGVFWRVLKGFSMKIKI